SDERRYHEALVHPAMNGPHARVLVLGGGDGLAVREVLRHRGVRRVDVVELDTEFVELARTDPALSALNGHAYGDPRVRVVAADAFGWLRQAPRDAYDVVVSDLPDPENTSSTKLYSQEFYGLAREVLGAGGRLVVHAGPVAARPHAFWTVDATVRAAGLRTVPYSVGGRDSEATDGSRIPHDWGYVLASRARPRLGTAAGAPGVPSLQAGVRAAARTRLGGLPPSTLVHPRYAD
ncbi:spermidine synthase, partial [Streptomyces anthocyanicus]